jgi:hypothetical protein
VPWRRPDPLLLTQSVKSFYEETTVKETKKITVCAMLAAFSVVLSLYVVLWAIVVSLWAAFGALVGCAFGGIAGGVGFAIGGFGTAGLAAVGAGLVLAGLSILLFYGCRAVTRGAVWITKRPFAKGKKKEVSA